MHAITGITAVSDLPTQATPCQHQGLHAVQLHVVSHCDHSFPQGLACHRQKQGHSRRVVLVAMQWHACVDADADADGVAAGNVGTGVTVLVMWIRKAIGGLPRADDRNRRTAMIA